MGTYLLPMKSQIAEVANDPAKMGRVVDRIVAALEAKGYAVDRDKIVYTLDNRIEITTDKDPTADWALFDLAKKTDAEQAVDDAKAAIRPVMAKLKTGTATAAQVQQVLYNLCVALNDRL